MLVQVGLAAGWIGLRYLARGSLMAAFSTTIPMGVNPASVLAVTAIGAMGLLIPAIRGAGPQTQEVFEKMLVDNKAKKEAAKAKARRDEVLALYERIVDQGKSKKLALLAVCNKLLKQSFAIAKSGMPYNENFVSKLV